MNADKLKNGLITGMTKLSQNKYLQGISKGFMMALPAIIAGAFSLIFLIIPFGPYQTFLVNYNIPQYLSVLMKFTTNFVGIIYTFTITFSLAKEFEIDEGATSLLSLISFFILTPFDPETGNLITQWYGTQGIFTAMVISILVVKIYELFETKGLVIKMPETVPAFVQKSFNSLVPGVVIMSIITLISGIMSNTNFGSLHQVIYDFVQAPLQNLSGGPLVAVFIAFLVQLVWIFGIHASAVMAVMAPIWQANDIENLNAYQIGEELPNIVSTQFMETYSVFTVLPLALLIVIAKSQQLKVLGGVSIIPSIFNVSEPILFGLPIVLNPIYAIPFLIYKPLCIVIAYVLTALEIVPKVMGVSVPFGTPIVFSGLMQGSWKIALLQFLLLILGLALYYPFFRVADRKALAEEQKSNEIEEKDIQNKETIRV